MTKLTVKTTKTPEEYEAIKAIVLDIYYNRLPKIDGVTYKMTVPTELKDYNGFLLYIIRENETKNGLDWKAVRLNLALDAVMTSNVVFDYDKVVRPLLEELVDYIEVIIKHRLKNKMIFAPTKNIEDFLSPDSKNTLI